MRDAHLSKNVTQRPAENQNSVAVELAFGADALRHIINRSIANQVEGAAK